MLQSKGIGINVANKEGNSRILGLEFEDSLDETHLMALVSALERLSLL